MFLKSEVQFKLDTISGVRPNDLPFEYIVNDLHNRSG